MKEEDIQKYKSILEKEKIKLEAELSTVGRPNPDNPGDWEATQSDTSRDTDPNDKADNIEDYENNAAILKELEDQLVDVKIALGKIEDGDYGKCEVSGEDIEKGRLDANPAARTCTTHMNEENNLL